ncbi:MAG: hypothetical protein NC408_00690 [Candidatus Gastranaerophilales bacterium]|nr:hypothetical protein [Candidatus Gastranaerophilales bacterium]
MRKSLLVILFFALILPVFADEWDDFGSVERMWDGQKSITNKEFEEVMDALQTNQKQKEEKQKKKKIKKISGGGNSLHNDLGVEKEINEIPNLKNKAEEGVLVNIPVRLILGDNILDKGFYKLIARRDDNQKIYVSFYQSQFFKGEIEATETEDDFGEDEIDFAKLSPYNKSFMRMIFGSLDFNAYSFIPYIED